MAGLIQYPDIKSFGPGGLLACRKLIEFTEENTEYEPIDSPTQIMLTKEGLTVQGKQTLTSTALSQICRILCPGLIKVVFDIGVPNISDSRVCLPALAVDLYNQIVKARFDLLTDKSLVKHLKLRRIDGIIGAGYQKLSNKDFLEMLEDATSVSDYGNMQFYEANLIGRTLTVCFCYPKIFTNKPENYYSGFYFSNSEVGDTSVKVAHLLIRDSTKDRAIQLFKRGRMIHSGKDFRGRVKKAIYNATSKGPQTSHIKRCLLELDNLNLGFQNLDYKATNRKIDALVSRLSRKGLGNQAAERAVMSALYQGRESRIPQADQLEIRRKVWGTRTEYDLFVSLIRDAKRYSPSVREAMERTAYSVLIY